MNCTLANESLFFHVVHHHLADYRKASLHTRLSITKSQEFPHQLAQLRK